VSTAELFRGEESVELHTQILSLTPSRPTGAAADVWQPVSDAGAARTHGPDPTAGGSVLESGVSVISALNEAPLRTLHSASIVRSSPLSSSVRAMIERREFGRRYDAIQINLDALRDRLPPLKCPPGEVEYLASDRSFEDLSRSVDGLLQHRKRLVASSINRDQKRHHVLVLGAGPGGLMTAIQLSLRDHRVVVCEQREVYARNRYIGVYKDVAHLMAALGMPESMTYDFSQYRGKRGIMLADIQTFLHGVALKLGVIIYTGAIVRDLSAQALRIGELELQRAPRGGAPGVSAIGMTRWHYDTISRVRSGVAIRFDTIVEATGGRSGLRELLVGPDNVVSLRTLGHAAATSDPSLNSFFDNPEDHCAEYVDSSYGCPPGLREPFAAALLSGEDGAIPDEIPCFVSNIDASVFSRPLTATADSAGLASRIGDRKLNIPPDWVVLECRLSDHSLSRYHVEGPLPQSFEFGGRRLSTREALETINPVSLLLRLFYAMGVPFDAIDRRRLIEFYTTESSHDDASDIVSTWVGKFRGLRLGAEQPIWCGKIPASESVEYAIVGEALQNAWYRFGVGVDDTFMHAMRFAEGIELTSETRLSEALRLEREMMARSVQILYHLYGVARNTEQGVVGSVLTEYHMEEQHSMDIAEGRLREVAREGAEILAAGTDVCGADPLLEAALDYQRETCCRRALALLDSFPYPPELLKLSNQPMRIGEPAWRAQAFATLDKALSPQHRELLAPLFAPAPEGDASIKRPREERLAELGLGRYGWATPWVRVCALRALDPSAPGAIATLTRAAADSDPMVAETATAALPKPSDEGVAPTMPSPFLTIDKVVILRAISLFKAIPHQVLARVAALLTERWLPPEARIIEKGDVGDCLYVIASGHVRVHDGDRILQELGPGQCFGELALLDAKPRSATVSAVEPAHLLRLAQGDFYALMSERPDITQAINRVLCEMVRSANAAKVRATPVPAV
jgi:hypothetical protein